jgi:hypothetical protein
MLSMPRIVRPDSFRVCESKVGSPAEPATRRFIKRNKELAEISAGKHRRQVKHHQDAGSAGWSIK